MFFINNPIGIRFDIDKLNKHNENHSYGYTAWKIFWKAVDVSLFNSMEKYYHGDSQATLSGIENVFIIAFETSNNNLIHIIRESLISDKDCNSVCSAPQFIEGNDLMLEPLMKVGKFDLLGNFIEQSASGYDALETLKKLYNYEIQYDKTSSIHTAIKPLVKIKKTKGDTTDQKNTSIKSEIRSKNCPKCGLINPGNAVQCDCGHSFVKKTINKTSEIINKTKVVNIKDPKARIYYFLEQYCSSNNISRTKNNRNSKAVIKAALIELSDLSPSYVKRYLKRYFVTRKITLNQLSNRLFVKIPLGLLLINFICLIPVLQFALIINVPLFIFSWPYHIFKYNEIKKQMNTDKVDTVDLYFHAI